MGDPKNDLAKHALSFRADLEEVFGAKSREFSDHLKGMLFEIWNRALERPASAEERLAMLEALDRKKFEVQEEIERKLPAIVPALEENLRQIAADTLSFEFENKFCETLRYPSLEPMKLLAERIRELLGPTDGVARVLEFDDEFFELVKNPVGEQHWVVKMKEGSRPESGVSSSTDTLHDSFAFDEQLAPDELQKQLRVRLAYENLLPQDWSPLNRRDWLPVMIHRHTGRQGALHFEDDQVVGSTLIQTYLTYDQMGSNTWFFPQPRPLYDENDMQCSHIKIVVNGEEVDNSLVAWDHVFDNDLCVEVVTQVTMSHVDPNSIVQATYNVLAPLEGF